jgi:uncharacterized protein involved in outer membrane biogenesis
MNRLLLAIGGLLVGLLATLFVAPAMVDWNRYRGILEEEATRFLGREVRVGGRVNLRLLPVPYVQFEQVRVADTQASVGRPLFKAEEFTVWLSIGALLSGAIEARDIELRKPAVTLVLDGKGGGNWASLSPENFRSRFVPARVAFDAVRISGGTLEILAPDGTVKTSFGNINGELSAQALEGPYRLTAAFERGGAAREIRFSTAKATEDGTVHFKGTVRDPSSGISYSLEGDARDVLGDIAVAGQVTARLPLPASLASQEKAAGASSGAAKAAAAGEFDMRAALEGNTRGFTLADLSLSFEQEGRPQLASGSARVDWAEQTDIAVTLHSHWLDLDKIVGAGSGGTPLELAQGVAAALARSLATEGRTRASLTIEQATLGGDVVSNLATVLEYAEGRLNVKSLSAALPGGARLVASGAFEGQAPDLRYAGRVILRGASMTRFAGWVAADQKLSLPLRDGPFNLVGDLSLGSKLVAARNLSFEVGRNVLTGDASWQAGQPQQIMLNLEGSELDLTPVVPAGEEPARALRDLIAALAGVETGAAVRVRPADADIRLRLDRLLVGSTTYRDAVAEMKLAGGSLSIQQLRLASTDGYEVDLKGDVSNLAETAAKGALTGVASAETAQGVAALARLAGLPADLVSASEREAAMAPLRLAGRLQVGLKGPDSYDLMLDGTLAGSRVAGTFRLGRQQAVWRDRPMDFAVSLSNGAARWLLARAVGAGASPATASPAEVRLVLRGLGNLKGGLSTLAAVDADGIDGSYRGSVSLNDKAELGLDGEVTVALADLARGLALAGLPGGAGIDGPVAGKVHVERHGPLLKIASSRFRAGGAEVSGGLAFETRPDATRATGDVKLSHASLQGLFALLAGREGRSRPAAPGQSPWSEAALDLSPVERLAGSQVRLTVGRLAIAPGLEVGDAQVDLTARADGLDLRMSDAGALGGHVSAILALSRAPAGVRMVAEGAITGAKLDRIVAAGASPTALGGLTTSLKVESTALSARGLIVALSGAGEARLAQARLTRWTPAAVGTAVDSVLALQGELPPGALRTALELALQSQGVNIGAQRLAITVTDGVMRVEPLVVAVPQGQLTGKLSVDLDHLLIDGEWRIEGRGAAPVAGARAGTKPELPPVVIRYAGPLASLAGLQPKLDMDALEREVAVRKVEREVAELERLRRLDEQRAGAEAQRQLAERIAAEQRRLEELRRRQQEAADRQAAGLSAPQTTPAAAGGPADAGEKAAAEGQRQDAAGSQPSDDARVPAAAPRPAPAARPNASRRDPFAPMRESNP